MPSSLLQSDLPLPVRRGKVRDVYDLGDKLLIVATDRISAFDCIMPNGIPGKGKILTALSLFWFARFAAEFPNHLLASNFEDFPRELAPYRDQLEGRSMLVRKARVIPIECVARGYLAGSGWAEYQKSNPPSVCGNPLPAGLRQCDRLPTPIFTPATKEDTGHDINISFEQAAARIGTPLATTLRDRTLALYTQAADYAADRGILIADTKFEFGILPASQSHSASGEEQRLEASATILIDEILTPDSSRFWPAADYTPGRDQASFDKQYVRNYLQTLTWNKTPPAPPLPPEVVSGTKERYLEAYRLIVGKTLEV